MKVSQMRYLSTALLLLTSMACAPSVKSVDRTQPNAVKKTQFAGLWYYRPTVTKVDAEAPFYPGMTGGTEKVRWEITEDRLIAYRSYEFIPYAEGLTDEGRDFFGSPVAAFKITKHFDIQRSYNPTTGVESGVIEENTRDRPWNEREYMRVDWTNNVVGNKTRLWMGWVNQTGLMDLYAVAKHYVQGHESNNPDRPIFTENYFDVSNVYQVEPSTGYCYYMLLFQGSQTRCGAANATMRLSFRKIDPADDYESLYYPDNLEIKDDQGNAVYLDGEDYPCDKQSPGGCYPQLFGMDERFGNFRVMRPAFDEERYFTRSGRMFMAGRFDLWEKSFDAEGARIPYPARTPKPIVYYGVAGFPEEMISAVQGFTDEWAEPLEDVVAFRMGKMVENDAKRPDRKAVQDLVGGRMFQFKENSCNPKAIKAYAEANNLNWVIEQEIGSVDRLNYVNVENICAAIQFVELQQGKTLDPKLAEEKNLKMAFSWERLGDLRFNYHNYIRTNIAGPWGVAQFAQDPESGEFIGANIANYFENAGDRISESEVDVLQWLNGDLSSEDLFAGTQARKHLKVSKRMFNKNGSGAVSDATANFLGKLEKRVIDSQGPKLFAKAVPGFEHSNFKKLWAGSELESQFLVNDDMLRSVAEAGAIPGFQLGAGEAIPADMRDKLVDKASAANWGITPENNSFELAARDLGSRAIDMAAFFDPNTAGMAQEVKGWSRDKIWNDLRVKLYRTVMAHEVGHTIGLRHNFYGSLDPLNYPRAFWYDCSDGSDNCNEGEAIQRWTMNDAPPKAGTTGDLTQLKHNEYKYASVMDYAFDIPFEGYHGLGSYDTAAVRFQYGLLVDVFDNEKISLPDARLYGDFAARCGFTSSFWGVGFLTAFGSPENLPAIFSEQRGKGNFCKTDGSAPIDATCDTKIDKLIRAMTAEVKAQANTDDQCALYTTALNKVFEGVRKYAAGEDDFKVKANNIYDARMVVGAETLLQQKKSILALTQDRSKLSTFPWAETLTEVPYKYCTDTSAGYSWPFCQRWDAGWDLAEQVQNHVQRFDRDYLFSHFRRDKLSGWGNPNGYMQSLFSRRLRHMSNVFRYYMWTRSSNLSVGRNRDFAESTYIGLNFLERVLQSPEPGRYCLSADGSKYSLWDGTSACAEPYEVGLGFGEGNYLNSTWSGDYNYQQNRLGFFYDKLAVIAQMTLSSGYFYASYDDFFDARASQLGYLRVYLDPMLQRFSALIRGDHTGYQAHVVTNAANEKYVRYTPFFDEQDTYGQETGTEGASIRNWLNTGNNSKPFPVIDPAWSWDLQFYGTAFAISNWSGVFDYVPQASDLLRIAIKGGPEDMDYQGVSVVEFTDPVTLLTYRAPSLPGRSASGSFLSNDEKVYYGNRQDRAAGHFHPWGVGGQLLTEANTILTRPDGYNAAKTACDAGTAGAWASPVAACEAFEKVGRELRQKVEYINIVRKFVARAGGSI